ncbi:GNAT family N-acetyltransferase [Bacillus sp. MRMR6]|uniref:GNAT family N-acetyltransferase n=1 Tax=Bacillus sp. MRMR6 TaxID=1928617 RepID=UPI000951A702|nr:GNAT family N-acetyltransferase [Bacillus sp. MRMR6]OLS40714.1 hypothetical protein BTR25_07400 [Bacillus sp. MRMR6]
MAVEVVEWVLDYGFHAMNLTEIVAETQTRNIASCNLLKKVGMKAVETLKRFGNQQTKFVLESKDFHEGR